MSQAHSATSGDHWHILPDSGLPGGAGDAGGSAVLAAGLVGRQCGAGGTRNSSSRPWPRTPFRSSGRRPRTGSLAKKTLLFAVLLGIAAVGYQAGKIAGRLTRTTGTGFSGRAGRRDRGRRALALHQPWSSCRLPISACSPRSSYTEDILIQMTATFALFRLVWAAAAVLLRGGPPRRR